MKRSSCSAGYEWVGKYWTITLGFGFGLSLHFIEGCIVATVGPFIFVRD